MKNKKGFTLVELLAVIVILGILTAIAVPSVLGISKKIKENMWESKLKTIEVATELYIEDNKNTLCVSKENIFWQIKTKLIKDLIKENYLKADNKSGEFVIATSNINISDKALCSNELYDELYFCQYSDDELYKTFCK